MKKNLILIVSFLILGISIGSAQNRITGSTARFHKYIPIDSEFDVDLSDFIGNKRLDFGMLALDGKSNAVVIDLGAINAEMNTKTGGGRVEADLKIAKLFINSEGMDARYNLIGVSGHIGDLGVSLELSFEPDWHIVSSTAVSVEHVPETYYRVRLSNKKGVVKEYGNLALAGAPYLNIASQAHIRYSSISRNPYKGYYPNAGHTTDGIIKNSYNHWSAGSPPAWISYQFDEWINIERIVIYSGSVQSGELKYGVEYLDSNGQWKDYFTTQWINGNNKYVELFTAQDKHQIFRHELPMDLSSSEIRITVTDSQYPYSHLWRTVITEVEIYGRQ